MEAPILSVANINKHFGGLAAICNLSFDVQAGEVLGLMAGAGVIPCSALLRFQIRRFTGLLWLSRLHQFSLCGISCVPNWEGGWLQSAIMIALLQVVE